MREQTGRKRLELVILIMIVLGLTVFTPTGVNASKELKNVAGLGVFYGKKIPDNKVIAVPGSLKWDYVIIHPKYGWLIGERWQLDLEGNFGKYEFEDGKKKVKDTFSLGLSLMASYEFLQYEKFSLYADVGCGLGYWDRTPDNGLVDRSTVIGIIQYGAGIKIPVGNNYYARAAYRFEHGSGIRKHDSGCNTHGIFLGVELRF